MAFEPYLMSGKEGCFRGPLPCSLKDGPSRLPRHDPNCTTDKYTDYFRGRWNILRQDVCNRCPTPPLCPIKCKRGGGNKDLYGPYYNPSIEEGNKACTGICIPSDRYEKGKSNYEKFYEYPLSHNNIDDCCKSECPCAERGEDLQGVKREDCTRPRPYPPLDDCTTYKHFHTWMPTPCPPRRHRPGPWDPCECPLESATSYRIDYHAKFKEPMDPVLARTIRPGLWSIEQMCKNFSDATENKFEYTAKCGRRRLPYLPKGNLKCGDGTVDGTSETCAEFGKKSVEEILKYPEWIHNDTWVPPETALERCTTYKHFYKPYPIRPNPGYQEIQSPDAIPFSSMNNIWYTCCDPVVDQRTPVEMKDDDPWPRVITEQIRYKDNLFTDPCSLFRDDTTYKADYWAKKRCAPNKWYGPSVGYTPPILPLIDITTNRMSYVAYPPDVMEEAKQKPGNPNGIKWGPYRCPPEQDKCKPTFPAPYGHPLKPYTGRCPCGQFDDRSMYYKDFKFWTPEVVEMVKNEQRKCDLAPKGLSTYRADFATQGGKKAEIMPPPKSKGERCMKPCNHHDLDSLYKLEYKNFWKDLPYDRIDKYRGHPTIKTRRTENNEQAKPQEDTKVFQMPEGTTIEETLAFLEKEKEQQQLQQQKCNN